MSGLYKRQGAGGMTTDEEMWAGLDRGDPSIIDDDDVPVERRIRTILFIYTAILCVGVMFLVH